MSESAKRLPITTATCARRCSSPDGGIARGRRTESGFTLLRVRAPRRGLARRARPPLQVGLRRPAGRDRGRRLRQVTAVMAAEAKRAGADPAARLVGQAVGYDGLCRRALDAVSPDVQSRERSLRDSRRSPPPPDRPARCTSPRSRPPSRSPLRPVPDSHVGFRLGDRAWLRICPAARTPDRRGQESARALKARGLTILAEAWRRR